MADHIIPNAGAWVLIIKEVPCQNAPTPLSLYWAMPDKLFPKGWHTDRFPGGAGLDRHDLSIIYRTRNGSRTMLPEERERMEELERRSREDHWNPISLELDQRVRIMTDKGDVCIEPHEWNLISDITPYMDEVGEGYELKELSGAKMSSRMEEQVFYMQSRGLPRSSAIQMLLATTKRPAGFWLEPHPELVNYFFRKAA